MSQTETTWETLLSTRIKEPGSLRLYFALLQGMLLVLYYVYVQPFSMRPLSVWLVMTSGLFVAILMAVMIIPHRTLNESWFISALTMSNAGLLAGSIPMSATTHMGLLSIVILLLAMASYVQSFRDFGVLSLLIVNGYGLLLHHANLLQTDAVLVPPVLLCLTVVLLSKLGIVQAEMQHLAEVTIQHTPNKDPLTGLPIRAQFVEQLGRIIQYRHMNRNFQFAVLFVDLDGFKPINDKLGHKAGDAVLRHVAKLLQSCLRKGDLIGRHGGDEFTILLNDVTSPRDAGKVAQHILDRLHTPIHVGESVTVGASIGIAMSTNLHETADDLIRDADTAMYRAKGRGKNCYLVSDQSDLSKAELKERWKRIVQMNWLLQSRRL